MNMNLAIIGSREFTDQVKFELYLHEAIEQWGMPDKIVSGGARGADTLGERWAKANGYTIDNGKLIIHKADWDKHGKAAGIIRNYDIIRDATHFLAFPSHKGRGTQHTVGVAQGKNMPVIINWID